MYLLIKILYTFIQILVFSILESLGFVASYYILLLVIICVLLFFNRHYYDKLLNTFISLFEDFKFSHIFFNIFIIFIALMTMYCSKSFSYSFINKGNIRLEKNIRYNERLFYRNKTEIGMDKKEYNYVYNHKSLDNKYKYKKLSEKSNSLIDDYNVPLWKIDLYENAEINENRYKLLSYYRRDKFNCYAIIKYSKKYLKKYKPSYLKYRYKSYIGLSNITVSGYLLLYLLVLLNISILYSLINKYVVQNIYDKEANNIKLKFVNCIEYIIDGYVFHILPILIAFVSGLLAVLSNNIGYSKSYYLFLIKWSIPILSVIQFLRILYFNKINKELEYIYDYLQSLIKFYLSLF